MNPILLENRLSHHWFVKKRHLFMLVVWKHQLLVHKFIGSINFVLLMSSIFCSTGWVFGREGGSHGHLRVFGKPRSSEEHDHPSESDSPARAGKSPISSFLLLVFLHVNVHELFSLNYCTWNLVLIDFEFCILEI